MFHAKDDPNVPYERSKCKIGEPFSRFDVERTCIPGGRTHGEEQEDRAEDDPHWLVRPQRISKSH